MVLASHPTPLPLLLHLYCLTMHFPMLFIFVLHRPDRSSSEMVYGLDVNHPAPPLPLLRSSHPPLLILFLSLAGTHSVVTLTLVLSLISTKCLWITSPWLSTLRTIATAPTLFPFPRNISSRPFLSTPGEYVSPRGVSAIPFRLALERDYPPLASPLASPSPPSSPHLLLLSGRPARRIQSDSDPKRSSACRSSAGCCHGTVQSDLPYPSLVKTTRAPSGRPPLTFSRSSLDSLLAGFLFFFLILDVALLHKQPLAFEIAKLPWWIKRVWFPSSAPPSLFF